MYKLAKMKNPLIAAAAFGVIGLSVYGVFNTVNAYAGDEQASGPDYTNTITIDATSSGPDGSACSPYGCAACSGCSALQYQQTVEQLPAYDAVKKVQ